ncbi:S-adenosyl-L-methionine-dependent methyltransferase [Irpex rosettiformis]|uniref:S-adenosyl-L-methionine-dependent methyltransferase n=1 Tax=Irpex rosettiformis TaxID=378272 RepID=A0ACB8TP15_9APHY|nr:S-adenosyl-L-methionine-dependent methyltransferase [Irpex rosettiformis]
MSLPTLIQGHTPHDRLSYLLGELCKELKDIKGDKAGSLGEALSFAQQARDIVDGYDKYVARMSSSPPAIVNKMVDESYEHNWKLVHEEGLTQFRLIPEMSAGGYEAAVLRELAALSKARRILEIGMFTGTTTVTLAMIPTVEKVVALELEGYLKDWSRPYFEQAQVSDKIDVWVGDAVSSLNRLDEEHASFDLVFIDADKPNYLTYLQKVLEGGLLAQGGVIAVDNVAYRGTPWAPVPDKWYEKSGIKTDEFKQAVQSTQEMGRILAEFNEVVRNDPALEVVMLPVEDGISLVRRKGE